MSVTSLSDLLRTNPAFARLSGTSLDAVVRVSELTDAPAGEVLMHEGELNQDLILLVSGKAVATRGTVDRGDVELNDIAPGDCIGELAFLDAGPRSASIRARTACRIVRIRVDRIADPAVLGDLKGALASVVVRRVRSLSDDMLQTMREQLAARTLQNEFGHFLVFTIAIFVISTTLFYLVAERYVEDVYDPGFSWQAVLLLALPCLLIIRLMRIPAAQLGLKREGLWRAVWQAVAICTVVSAPALIWMVGFREPISPDQRPVQITWVFLAQYLVHTVAQEIGSRGLLQGLFIKFLNDTRGHRAIMLTSVIFASLHIAFGIDAVVLTFFASIILGYVYLYQKNLAGVIILHYWFGVLAAMMVAL